MFNVVYVSHHKGVFYLSEAITPLHVPNASGMGGAGVRWWGCGSTISGISVSINGAALRMCGCGGGGRQEASQAPGRGLRLPLVWSAVNV